MMASVTQKPYLATHTADTLLKKTRENEVLQADKCIFLKHLSIFSTINLITMLNTIKGHRI